VELQQLTQERILDAQTLLSAGRWTAAYYLAGYAVECALKSCVLAHLDRTGMIFRDREYLKKLADCWVHNLTKLVDLAGLTIEFGRARGANPILAANWEVASQWTETSRYEQRTEADAKCLLEAITLEPDGILPWLRTRW
jgi:hypothetical protein